LVARRYESETNERQRTCNGGKDKEPRHTLLDGADDSAQVNIDWRGFGHDVLGPQIVTVRARDDLDRLSGAVVSNLLIVPEMDSR
jgi:hypothetical protein